MERTTIWYPGDGYEFAARELAEYAEKITGRKAALTDQDGMPAEADRLFVIGSPGTKTLAPFAGSMEKRQTTKQLGSPQSFAIWTEIAEGRKCVLLAGYDTVASLYAVYSYLEEFCHVGFFQDGEYLPEQPLPFPEKLKTYKPSFIHRKAPFNVWGGHLGIKKFHTRFWNLDEIKRDLRWMAKRHLNHMVATIGIYNGITCELAREVCEELGYPIDPIREEEVYVSGFPVSWMWPPSYRVEMMREAFAYARTLGIKVIYGIRTGEVPMDFKKKYPQFTYVKEAELWEYAQLHPDDPFFEEFSSRYLRRIIETFGTDHLYCGLPYGETSPESNPEENFQLKSKGAMSFIKLLKAVDPEAIWVTDSWDIFWSPDTWTRKNVKTYLEKMPHDSFFIYDTNADNRGVPAFQEHNHFHGRKWAFGVMHSAAGHEQPHGDFHDLLKRVSDAVSRKDNNHCEGMFLVPELTHYDMFYYDFLTGVTWNSVPFDLDGFFDDFVLRRYG